ncbi:hypothetical protein J3A83DRAFT_4378402 [Scleroderma citrinum]
MSTKEYSCHWPSFFQEWLQCWLKKTTALPDLLLNVPLTPKQERIIADAVTKHQQQLWQWLWWHAGAGKNRSANRKMLTIINGLMKGKTHIKPLEIYSKMYYTSQVKPKIAGNSTDFNISNLHDHIEKKFRAEPQEIQDEVMCIHNKQSISKNMPAAECNKEINLDVNMDTQKLISQHPYSLHTRKNKHGLNFVESYSPFESILVQAYAEFLDSKYYMSTDTEINATLSVGKKTGNGEQSKVNDNTEGGENNDGEDDRNENKEDGLEISEDQEGDDVGDVVKVTSVAMSSHGMPVATTLSQLIASSIPTIAMPLHVAMSSSPIVMVLLNGATSECALTPPSTTATLSPTHCNIPASVQSPNLSDQLLSFQGFDSLVLELEKMLSTDTMAMFTPHPQWNYNPFITSHFTTTHLTVLSNMDESLHHLAMVVLYYHNNLLLGLPPLPPTSLQLRGDLPLLPPTPSEFVQTESDGIANISQLSASISPESEQLRDNMIGIIGKENSLQTETRVKKKHPVMAKVKDGPAKNSKKRKSAV